MSNLLETIQIKSAVRQIANGKVNFDATKAHIEKSTLYFRKALCGLSGIQQLIKPADVEKDGVRNIDSARLPSGEAFLVTGIVFSTAKSEAKLTDEKAISALSFTTGMADGNLAKFLNSEFSLKVGNKEKLKTILRHAKAEMKGDDVFDKAAYQVTPFIIEPQQNISPDLNIFDLPCAADKDLVLEVALVGYKISGNNA